MRSNAPQNQPPFPGCSTRQTHSARNQWHDKRSAQHSTRAAAACDKQHDQPCDNMHFLHATPRHTLHHHLSPAPRHVGHVHIGRARAVAIRWHANATQGSMTRTRPHGENSVTTQPRGSSASCPVMRKKTLLAFDELERAHDLRSKLHGRQQLAAIGDDDN